MKKWLIAIASVLLTGVASAQTTRAVTDADPLAAINSLRTELVDSFNKGDVDRLLVHLAPDVVITWQNGEVCRGPEQVRAYYKKMMSGPDRIVASVQSNPQVIDRHLYGDWAVSWGVMNDHFTLTDGRDLDMNSKFTATIARSGDEWKVTSFHLSVNVFDNAILGLAIRKASMWAAVIVGVVALVAGIVFGRLTKRKPGPA
ncbi:MAG TPA: nuclear transport factor 2 family protein [Tepidisphaeraceae bacterium]|nr:nuclear transport factor 2 family protein [Tepidisphaeraceae bacterium]